MFHAYSPVLAQIRVKNRTRIQLALVLFQGYRERANAAVIEDYVAMAVGISDASLITKKRSESIADEKNVIRFFRAPPVVFQISSHVVIADDARVHLGSVD